MQCFRRLNFHSLTCRNPNAYYNHQCNQNKGDKNCYYEASTFNSSTIHPSIQFTICQIPIDKTAGIVAITNSSNPSTNWRTKTLWSVPPKDFIKAISPRRC